MTTGIEIQTEVPRSQTNFNNFFGRRPQQFIYEDDQCVVFEEEVNPQAPVHFLVIPRKVIPRLALATGEDEKLLGHLLLTAKNIAIQKGLPATGYHVMVDEDFKSMKFKCLHVFGRALHHMLWPTGPGSRL